MLQSFLSVSVLLVATFASSFPSQADEPKTLLGQISEWQYPGAKLSGATMSDAATLNKKGERTVPSIQSRAVMTTTDPIAKVFAYYQSKLVPDAVSGVAESQNETAPDLGRSVTFHHDSENRPVTIHIIVVSTNNTSTTLVISRTEAETEIHIAWTQYTKFSPN